MTDHGLFSIFWRDEASGVTGGQRLALLALQILTIMGVQALFYGQSGDSIAGDVSMTVVSSLVSSGVPIFLAFLVKGYRREWDGFVLLSFFFLVLCVFLCVLFFSFKFTEYRIVNKKNKKKHFLV